MRHIGVAALLLLIVGSHAGSSVRAFHRAYGPKAALLVSSPTLSWEVWPSEGSRVTSASMTVNGQQVDAVYSEGLRRLEYQPSRPLPAGSYSVRCKVVVDNRLTVDKDWEFQVSPNAISELPSPNAEQVRALEIADDYRRPLGLPEMQLEARLNAASLAHANYLAKNHRTGHYEKQGEPGFVGVTPEDRLEAFGYSGSSWECVTYNSGGVAESVRDLFNAPYHRIPFLQPGKVPFGAGFVGKNLSLKFGDSDIVGDRFSPGADQEGVPTSWDGNESPNPLRMHPDAKEMVGYPIVFAYFSPEDQSVALKKAVLTRGGETIECYVNSPDNDDHLQNAILLIPKKPLTPNTTYSAHFEVKIGVTRTITRDWNFTTGTQAGRK